MDENTRATIDITALIAQAIEQKRAEEQQAYTEVEQTPKGERLTWKVTPEQVAKINACDREAIDEFYFENYTRILYSAYRFMRNNAYVKAVASFEDLIQQLYFDLRTGAIKLRPFDSAISGGVFTSFRYAPVGGYDEVYIYKAKELAKCQRAEN